MNSYQTITPERIAEAAYLLFLKAGQPAGRGQEFWRRAEAQLRNGMPAPVPNGEQAAAPGRADLTLRLAPGNKPAPHPKRKRAKVRQSK